MPIPSMYYFNLLLTCCAVIHASTLPILTVNTSSVSLNSTISPVDLPTFRGHCVNEKFFPSWTGAIIKDDCFVAQHDLELQVRHILKKQYTFWSKDYTNTAPRDGWELPRLAEYKTCVLLIQITKDFGNDVIPFYQGGYLPTDRLSTTVKGNWETVLGAIAAVRQQCVKSWGQPGWADIAGAGGAKVAIVLAIPAGNKMARDWAVGLGRGAAAVIGGTAVE